MNENQFVKTNTVLLKSNIKYLSNIGELLSSLSVKEVQLSFPHGTSSLLNRYSLMVPTFTQVRIPLYETIQFFQQVSIKVSIEAIPPCLLRGYEKCYADYSEAKYPNFLYESSHNETKERICPFSFKMEKIYTKRCILCDYRTVCAGVYEEYLANYGDYELQPVKINLLKK